MAEEIKGLQIAIGATFSEFKKELKAFDKDLNFTQRQLRATQQSLNLEFSTEKLQKAQQLAQKAIRGTEERAEALKTRLNELEKAGINDDNRREYEQLQLELQHTENRAKRLQNQLKELNNAKLNHLSKQIEGVGQSLEKAGRMMAPFSALATGALAGLTAMKKSAMEAGAALDDMTMFMDMSAESYQKLQYVSAQTGAEMKRVERAFVLLRDTMGKSLFGEVNKSTEALQRLGFELHEIQNADPETMFMETIKRLAAMEDQTLQVALATDIFNQRVAHDILPMLRSGATAIDDLTAEFETLGYMTNEQVSAWAALDDQWLRIRTALGAIKDQIASHFLPVWQSAADFVENKVVPTVRKVLNWLDGLSDGQKKAIVAVSGIVSALAPLLLISGKLTTALGGLVKQIGEMPAGLQKLLGPLGIIIGILALLYTTSDEFRNAINELVQTLFTTLAPVLSTIGDLFNTLMQFIAPLISMIGDKLSGVIRALTPLIVQILGVVNPLLQLLLNILMPILVILTPILNEIITVLGAIADVIASVITWVSNLAGSLFSFIEKVLDPVIDKLGKLWGWLKKILGLNDKKVDIEVNAKSSTAQSTSGLEDAMKQQQWASNFVTQNQNAISNMYTTNNDYSNKNIEVNLTVHNYAEPVDPEWLVEQINIEMAKQF